MGGVYCDRRIGDILSSGCVEQSGARDREEGRDLVRGKELYERGISPYGSAAQADAGNIDPAGIDPVILQGIANYCIDIGRLGGIFKLRRNDDKGKSIAIDRKGLGKLPLVDQEGRAI